MSEQRESDRRWNPRVPHNARCGLWLGNDRLQGNIGDLSLGGALVRAEAPAADCVGKNCLLEFGRRDDGGEPFEFLGRVVHQGEHGIGVRFQAVGIEALAYLRGVVGDEEQDDEPAQP